MGLIPQSSLELLTLNGLLGMGRLLGSLVLDEEDLRLVGHRALCNHLGANIQSVGLLGQDIDGGLLLHGSNVGNDLGLAGGGCGCVDEHHAVVLLGPAHVHIADDLLLIVILGSTVDVEVLVDLGGLEVGQVADVRLLLVVVDGGTGLQAGQANAVANDAAAAAAAGGRLHLVVGGSQVAHLVVDHARGAGGAQVELSNGGCRAEIVATGCRGLIGGGHRGQGSTDHLVGHQVAAVEATSLVAVARQMADIRTRSGPGSADQSQNGQNLLDWMGCGHSKLANATPKDSCSGSNSPQTASCWDLVGWMNG